MNKQQIKAELRRSACEDKDPIIGLNQDAWTFLLKNGYREYYSDLDEIDDWRFFFLLVAEAL